MEYKVDLKPRYGHGNPPHEKLYELINANRAAYQDLLLAFLENKEALHRIKKCADNTDSNAPCWNNGFLPGLDIVALYSLIKHFKPERYIEVGSGNSTKVAYKSIQENQLDTEIISIDPYPRAEIDTLSNTIVRQPFEHVNLDTIKNLKANDILFIDNSHRVLPNSDATAVFLDVLPYLKPGVVVHIHDIYLPYDYPQFMCDRFYSEQYMLAAFVLANPQRYQVLLPNYFISEDKELATLIAPIWQHPNLEGVERHGGSFWLQIGK